jgi:hypothetical protein
MQDKKVKITFAPGCFDSFEGSQKELDELITEINRLVESGDIFTKSTFLEFEEMLEDLDEQEFAEKNINFSNSRLLQ